MNQQRLPAGSWLRVAAASLPLLPSPATLLGKARRLLVLAPHPDDESLGCGGLLAATAAAGLDLRVVVVSDGAASHPGSRTHPPARLAALRQQEARQAVAALGLDARLGIAFLGLPDAAVPAAGEGFDQAVQRLLALADGLPSCVVAPWRHDPHGDHAATAAMARALLPMLPRGSSLYSYPVWGLAHAYPVPGFPLPPAPMLPLPPRGYRLEIRAWRAMKQQAIAAHRSQTTALIADSPAAFRLPPALLQLAAADHELYLQEDA